MNSAGPWTTDDFDGMSWHDVHVHGFRFDGFKESDGSADLILDIDYILKWEKSGDGFLFTVCRADLRFHDVFGLKVTLDYATPTAGMCPFSLAGVEREVVKFPTGHGSYRWRLPINWPKGLLEFQAPGFTQVLTGTPHVQSGQALAPEKRRGGIAA
ncbi:MAG TPA: hypothetical protein VN929_02425 [Burkholderiales bacterium]|nr:hypothetical protein [Burkholderiales bacterium]